MLSFNRISTWEPGFVAAIRRHYTGSRGAPVGKKMAWEIHEDGVLRGWIGIGEPSFNLAPRRLSHAGLLPKMKVPGTPEEAMTWMQEVAQIFDVLDRDTTLCSRAAAKRRVQQLICRVAMEASAKEREECAKLASEMFTDHYDHSQKKHGAEKVAAAIRARSDAPLNAARAAQEEKP